MHKHTAAICFATFACLGLPSIAGAQSSEPSPHTGFYLGGAGGVSRFSLGDAGGPVTTKDTSGIGFKVYGGWRFTENLGLEGGFAHLGKFSERVRLGAGEVEQRGRAQVVYGAVTGRLPLSNAFALNARAGVAFGRVSGTSVLSAAANPVGRKRGAMLGVGAEYSLSRNLAITADYDHFGKLSRSTKGGLLTLGLRASF